MFVLKYRNYKNLLGLADYLDTICRVFANIKVRQIYILITFYQSVSAALTVLVVTSLSLSRLIRCWSSR